MFSFSVHEHRIYFHMFVSSPVSFNNVLYFSLYSSYTSLGKLHPKYFILFNTMVNKIVFIISSSHHSLLVYRSASKFCILTLYPDTLLNPFIISNSLSVCVCGILGFSTHKIILQTVIILHLPFQFGCF